ncbi:biotin/lipoyl-containing protein, partial [Hydrogenophaga sp.]|uniref:ATP-binding protein n=1 Tax=Hydrogenophaga sp. TaxID=1904254 RepID=UPI00273010CC
FPLMVKAVAGGGGRGMRLVLDAAQLLPALHSARSEALSGFGNGDLLIERALLRPRHVEVQVFADAHGHCVHLGERDCSVQRWHQKIIEEAPSPAVSPALREALGRCAVALAQAAGYVGAGTVEFLVEASGAFFLMEMNTRLQVEHPVTEALTGLDLVEWQLRVARGEPLPLTQDQITFTGHAIEVRLCAEDDHHTPHTGRVGRFTEPPMAPGLRFDHALETGSEVTPHFDSMLGKLIAHAPTRAEAIAQLAHALDHTQVLGLPTNRAFLAACLRHPVFGAGDALIPFLVEHGDELRAHLAAQHAPGQPALVVAMLVVQFAAAPPAASLAVPFNRPLRFGLDDAVCSLEVQEVGAGQLRITLGETTHTARVEAQLGGALRVELEGRRWTACAVPTTAGRWHVQVHGGGTTVDTWLTELSHHPAQRAGGADRSRELRAPFNGKLIAVHAQPGSVVAKGAPLLVVESMKLEHTLSAPRDLTVETLSVAAGQQVAPGQLLITFSA